MRNRQSCWPAAIALTAILVACSFSRTPSQPLRMSQPATISSTGPPPLTTAIALPFEPMDLTFSASANKLYASGMEEVSGGPPQWREYVVSLSAPSGPIERFDTSIKGLQQHLVVNDKLRRGYALMMSGDIKVFSTDSDTLVSTAQKPSCSLEVLAINQATDVVYGGGAADEGACLVQFDADGHIVRENVVGPNVKGKSPMVGSIAVDSASGDVLYLNAFGVARADKMLKEKWRTPVEGRGEPMAMGFEPKTNTAYVVVGADPVISPTRISVVDAGTGMPKGEFSGPGHCQGFAATGDGRLFVIFFNSNDLYVLSDGASTLTKFVSLSDIPGWAPSDTRWLEVDAAGRRLFVSPGGDRQKIAIYQY
ncbi:MAG: hypothetical protein P4L48_04730 [Mycobacterium sp.]|nr:hypothetical protein [Mycobacterium sp.]